MKNSTNVNPIPVESNSESIGRFKNGVFKDKNGVIVEEFDVLKVFHFVGKRNKKHFMYKWAKNKDGYLFFDHLEGPSGSGYDPRSSVDQTTGRSYEL